MLETLTLLLATEEQLRNLGIYLDLQMILTPCNPDHLHRLQRDLLLYDLLTHLPQRLLPLQRTWVQHNLVAIKQQEVVVVYSLNPTELHIHQTLIKRNLTARHSLDKTYADLLPRYQLSTTSP